MFSYREFSDGAHEYRKRVSSIVDRGYEEVRSDNQLAILRLSKASDDKTLAHILTYLEGLLFEMENEIPRSLKDCIRLSIIFTYFKSIAQRCQLAMTKLDDIYVDTDVNYTLSTGGLLYTMQPRGIFSEELPRVRAKIPITDTPGRVRTIIHEAFIGIVALNPLRRVIPSFSYIFAFWECGNFIDSPTQLSGLCTTPGSRPVLIYESNPSAISLLGLMRKSPRSLNSILDYLLQLMGALQMAHSYADYTHYDLHSGNVLVQPLSEALSISYQEYSLITRERIIIIDNGLAHCSYRAIELFKPTTWTPEVERLRTLKMEHYGSVQNFIIGVHKDRSYPLGDVFRIFFDIYSLCSSEVQQELEPLVRHFFSDGPGLSRKLGGPSENASSMLNSFSLPPFRDDLYNYKYADFAKAIIDLYRPLFVTCASIPRSITGVSITEIITLSTIRPDYVPSYYELGIYAQLDNADVLMPRVDRSQEAVILAAQYDEQRRLEKLVYSTEWDDIPQGDLSLKLILSDKFYHDYSGNVWRCVNQVQGIRLIYSNYVVLSHSLALLNPQESAIETLASSLAVKPEDLATLSNYCRRCRVPTASKTVFRKLLHLSERIAMLLREVNMDRPVTLENHHINWYRTCITGILTYMRFAVQWGDDAANFGELDLHPIK